MSIGLVLFLDGSTSALRRLELDNFSGQGVELTSQVELALSEKLDNDEINVEIVIDLEEGVIHVADRDAGIKLTDIPTETL